MEKSPEAFRTISEVADLLDTPAHVLRFWESRFPQIRPVKRAGGRRYYRPGDVALLAGIKKLLHDDGLTIRGVQKILREQGIRHVAGLVAPLPDPEPGIDAAVEGDLVEDAQFLLSAIVHPSTPTETAQIIPLDQAFARHDALARPHVPTLTEADMVETDPEDVPEAPFIEAEEEMGVVERLPLFDHPGRAGLADQGEKEQGKAEPQIGANEAETPIPHESIDDRNQGTNAPRRADVDAGAEPTEITEREAAMRDNAGAHDGPFVPDDEAEQSLAAPASADTPASTAAPVEAEQPTLASLLRRSGRARLAPHRRELEQLRDRLADLRDRVAEASRRRIR